MSKTEMIRRVLWDLTGGKGKGHSGQELISSKESGQRLIPEIFYVLPVLIQQWRQTLCQLPLMAISLPFTVNWPSDGYFARAEHESLPTCSLHHSQPSQLFWHYIMWACVNRLEEHCENYLLGFNSNKESFIKKEISKPRLNKSCIETFTQF